MLTQKLAQMMPTRFPLESFENKGFNIEYDGTNSGNKDVLGKYQLAVKVITYDSLGNPIENVLYSKENPAVMNGTSLGNTAVYNLTKNDGLVGDFTGKEIVINVRAISDNNISLFGQMTQVF